MFRTKRQAPWQLDERAARTRTRAAANGPPQASSGTPCGVDREHALIGAPTQAKQYMHTHCTRAGPRLSPATCRGDERARAARHLSQHIPHAYPLLGHNTTLMHPPENCHSPDHPLTAWSHRWERCSRPVIHWPPGHIDGNDVIGRLYTTSARGVDSGQPSRSLSCPHNE